MTEPDDSQPLSQLVQAALARVERPATDPYLLLTQLARNSWTLGAMAGARMALDDPAIQLASTEYDDLLRRIHCRLASGRRSAAGHNDRR